MAKPGGPRARIRQFAPGSAALLTTAFVALTANASELRIRVLSAAGIAVPDAVVTAYMQPDYQATEATSDASQIVQLNQAFTPAVLTVRVGTTVRFPNRDRTRHHVYSFSPARTFEIRLYGDAEVPEIQFDKPGIVSLGCNIHDWMQGYVVVTTSPWAAVTDTDGQAQLSIPLSAVERFEAWHPGLAQPVNFTAPDSLTANEVVLNLPGPLEAVDQSRPANDPLADKFHRLLPEP